MTEIINTVNTVWPVVGPCLALTLWLGVIPWAFCKWFLAEAEQEREEG